MGRARRKRDTAGDAAARTLASHGECPPFAAGHRGRAAVRLSPVLATGTEIAASGSTSRSHPAPLVSTHLPRAEADAGAAWYQHGKS